MDSKNIFTCVRCGLKNPELKEQSCGHIYCHRCIAKAEKNLQVVCLLQHSNHQDSDNELCYFCNTRLDLNNIRAHYENCEMIPIKCILCNKEYTRKTLKTHVEKCATNNFILLLRTSATKVKNGATNVLSTLSDIASIKSILLLSMFTLIVYSTLIFNENNDNEESLITKVVQLAKSHENLERKIGNLEKLYLTLISLEGKAKIISKTESSYTFQYIWKVDEFSQLQENAKLGAASIINSRPFYSCEFGYKLRLFMYPIGCEEVKGTHLSLYLQVLKGPNDAILKWPIEYSSVFSLLDQSGENEHQSVTFKSDLNKANECFVQPEKEENTGWGVPQMILLDKLKPLYLIDDSLYIKATVTIYS